MGKFDRTRWIDFTMDYGLASSEKGKEVGSNHHEITSSEPAKATTALGVAPFLPFFLSLP